MDSSGLADSGAGNEDGLRPTSQASPRRSPVDPAHKPFGFWCHPLVYGVSRDGFCTPRPGDIGGRFPPPPPPPSVEKVHRAQAADGGDREERGGRAPPHVEPPVPQ